MHDNEAQPIRTTIDDVSDDPLSDVASDMLVRFLKRTLEIVQHHGSVKHFEGAQAEFDALRDELLAEDPDAALAAMKEGVKIWEQARDRRRARDGAGVVTEPAS